MSKATVVVISNARRGQGREDKVTSIQRTLWGIQTVNAAPYPKMPFNAQRDVVPISLLVHISFVFVVGPNSTIKSAGDRVAQAKTEPGKVAVGHGGNGTAMHLSVQLLKLMAGADFTEVAYRGSGPVALDGKWADVIKRRPCRSPCSIWPATTCRRSTATRWCWCAPTST